MLEVIKPTRDAVEEKKITHDFDQLMVRGPEPINYRPNQMRARGPEPINYHPNPQGFTSTSPADEGVAAIRWVSRTKAMVMIDPNAKHPPGYQLYFRKEAERLNLVQERMISLDHCRMFSRTWKVHYFCIFNFASMCT